MRDGPVSNAILTARHAMYWMYPQTDSQGGFLFRSHSDSHKEGGRKWNDVEWRKIKPQGDWLFPSREMR